MRKLELLFPMAGLGSRFAQAGYTTPKPLLHVDGVPMFFKAASSFGPIQAQKLFTFVFRREHAEEHGLAKAIRDHIPDARILLLDSYTRGAVETCLAAEEVVAPDNGLVVMDCDLWFRSATYCALIEASLSGANCDDGTVLNFSAADPRYSYADVRDGRVLRTAEKVVISNHAIAGAYYFATAGAFFAAAKRLIEKPTGTGMPEYYVSLLYNMILEQGGSVSAAQAEEYFSFGTPEELKSYTMEHQSGRSERSANLK